MNMSYTTDHEKNMNFLDSDQKHIMIGLVIFNRHDECKTNRKLNSFKLKGQIFKFLTFEFGYCGVLRNTTYRLFNSLKIRW
jgi:hypothetical protein